MNGWLAVAFIAGAFVLGFVHAAAMIGRFMARNGAAVYYGTLGALKERTRIQEALAVELKRRAILAKGDTMNEEFVCGMAAAMDFVGGLPK